MNYLYPKDGPVIEGRESEEIVFGKDQLKYKPLRCLVDNSLGDRRVTSRWTLTDEQRKLIAEGADIYLTLLTYGKKLQPILMAVEHSQKELSGYEPYDRGGSLDDCKVE